jgi:hypothetical protein
MVHEVEVGNNEKQFYVQGEGCKQINNVRTVDANTDGNARPSNSRYRFADTEKLEYKLYNNRKKIQMTSEGW